MLKWNHIPIEFVNMIFFIIKFNMSEGTHIHQISLKFQNTIKEFGQQSYLSETT